MNDFKADVRIFIFRILSLCKKINQRNMKINFLFQNKFRIFDISKAIKLRYKTRKNDKSRNKYNF